MAEARTDREQQTQNQTQTRGGGQEVATQRQSSPAVRRRGGFDYASNPFELMRRLTQQVFGPLGADLIEDTAWIPQIEVFQRDGKLVVRADLPGMTKEDVRVEVRDDAIVLSGERREEKREDREGYFLTERRYGSFQRVIPLPEGVNTDNIQAVFREGVLELVMDAPKSDTQQQRGKNIQIQESHESQSSR